MTTHPLRRGLSPAVAIAIAAATAADFLFNLKPGEAPADGAAPPTQDAFQSLREEFGRTHKEAADLVALAARENRELKPEEKQANDTRFARLEQIRKLLDEQQRFASLVIPGAPKTEAAEVTIQTPKGPPGETGKEEFNAAPAARGVAEIIVGQTRMPKEEFSTALRTWATNGGTPTDRRFATITTASQSGIFLPRSVALPSVPTAMNTFREAFAIHGVSPVETESTGDLNVPVLDASAGSTISQTASSDSENAPGLTNSYALNVLGYQSGSAWFSLQQLLATGFDILEYVKTDLAYAKDLAVESAATAAIIADSGITQVVTTATTTTLTYQNLVSLNNRLPKKYQRLKVIILGAAAYTFTEGLVDDNNRPVLVQDPQNQTLMKFNGTPTLRSDYFEAMTANKTIGVIISLMGFKLRDVRTQELHRYDRVPTRPGQVGLNLIGFHGWGYAVDAIAKLKTAAS